MTNQAPSSDPESSGIFLSGGIACPATCQRTTVGDWVMLAVIVAGVGAYVAFGGDTVGLGAGLIFVLSLQSLRNAETRRASEGLHELPYWRSASYWMPVMVFVWIFSLPSILLFACIIPVVWVLAVNLRNSPARLSVGTVLRGPVIGEPGYLDILAARYLLMMSTGLLLMYNSSLGAGLPAEWGIPPLMELFSWIVLTFTG